jgi:hypothetical protein
MIFLTGNELLSLPILIFLTASKIFRFNLYYVGPFLIGGNTMGNVTYFLGLLIVSSRYYRYSYSDKSQYMATQAAMIVSLLIGTNFCKKRQMTF